MIQGLQQARRFWDRLDHKTLFRVFAYAPIIVPGLPLMVAITKGVEIGEFVKQYGSFRLYRHSYVLRNGWRKDTGQYVVLIGEPAVPIRSAWLAPRTQFTRATDYIFVTKVPVKESDPAGVHRYILQSQRATQAVIRLMHFYEASEANQKAREAEQRHLARQERIMQALQQFEAAYAAEIRTEPTKDQRKKMLGSTVEEVEKQFRSAFVGVGVICLILLLLFISLIIPVIIVVAIIYALRRRVKSRAA